MRQAHRVVADTQVIEGDDHTVADRLEVIFRDLRHITPGVLSSDPTDTRQFPRWSRGFPPAESAVLASSVGYRYAFDDDTVTRQANAPALRALTRWFEDHRHPSE